MDCTGELLLSWLFLFLLSFAVSVSSRCHGVCVGATSQISKPDTKSVMDLLVELMEPTQGCILISLCVM